MKVIKWSVILMMLGLWLHSCSLDDSVNNPAPPPESQYKLVINEFLASNDACCADENGEFDDWIEIYNYGSDTVNIAGFFFSDDKANIQMSQIPNTDPEKTKIAPGGFLVLWADKQPEQGVLHLNIKLSSGGEDIVMTEPDGITVVDQYTYGPQTTDVSEGRYPDGGNQWKNFTTPTPGASNTGAQAPQPPSISNITVSPDTINPGDMVTITATVTDPDGDVQTVDLTYGPQDSLTHTTAMTGSEDTYTAQIGPFDDGSMIYFFIKASDSGGRTAVSDTLSFQVGYIPPVLYINEFLASNDSCCADEHGEYDDWIEIYNPGPNPVDIGGMYITDDLTDLTAWQIPTTQPDSTTIPPGGFLVLWADKQPEQGVLHVNIKLSSGGEQIGLTAPNGTTVIDSLTFGPQTTDVSYGRLPDGSDNWQFFQNPTPGAPNQ